MRVHIGCPLHVDVCTGSLLFGFFVWMHMHGTNIRRCFYGTESLSLNLLNTETETRTYNKSRTLFTVVVGSESCVVRMANAKGAHAELAWCVT